MQCEAIIEKADAVKFLKHCEYKWFHRAKYTYIDIIWRQRLWNEKSLLIHTCLPGYLQNKYSSFNYIMQINPKFLLILIHILIL